MARNDKNYSIAFSAERASDKMSAGAGYYEVSAVELEIKDDDLFMVRQTGWLPVNPRINGEILPGALSERPLERGHKIGIGPPLLQMT